MASGRLMQCHGSAASAQQFRQMRGMIVRHDGVLCATGDEHALVGQRTGSRRLVKHHHGPQQHAAGECCRAKLQQGGGDVGTVGKADGHEPCGLELIVVCRRHGKIGQGVRAPGDFGRIKHALGEARKEAAGAVLAYVAARAEQRGG